MSVITPILDTLLHDVLGRRTAAPALRSLNETVTAVRPTALLQLGQHDGMPDARSAGMPTVAEALGRPGTQVASGASLHHGSAMPDGAQARLSPVALVIADALGGFPSPSTLRIFRPLIPERMPLAPPLVAAQLQSSITDSGLFYEAHLARWYRGALSLTQLQREPQMQQPGSGRAPLPVGNSLGAGMPPAPSVQQSELYLPKESVEITSQQAGSVPGVARGASEPTTDFPPASRGATELSEPLQGIVRHQLELLALPVLRWEGEVWAGIFMQLMIQFPDSPSHADGGADEKGNDDGVIESELTLDLQRLGLLNVRLHLHAGQLGLTLRSDSLRCLRHLEEGRDALAARLRGCGFTAPDIRIALLVEMGSHD